jgi:hypothetical protein
MAWAIVAQKSTMMQSKQKDVGDAFGMSKGLQDSLVSPR